MLFLFFEFWFLLGNWVLLDTVFCPCLLCYSHEKDPLFGFLNRLGLVKEVDKREEFALGFPNLKT